MIRATIYGDDDGSDGASAWALDDDGRDGGPVRLASGTEPTRAAAESAAEDFARRFGSPLGRWAQGPLPGTRIALAEAWRLLRAETTWREAGRWPE